MKSADKTCADVCHGSGARFVVHLIELSRKMPLRLCCSMSQIHIAKLLVYRCSTGRTLWMRVKTRHSVHTMQFVRARRIEKIPKPVPTQARMRRGQK